MKLLEELKSYGYEGYFIPEYMHEGLVKYIEEHRETGGFLTSLLSNDLSMTLQRADRVNSRNLLAYIYFLMEFAPSECWGSSEKVNAWTKKND